MTWHTDTHTHNNNNKITRTYGAPPILPHQLLQVNEVKEVMVENIERVLERGEKIELLVDRTDDLRNQVCVCVCVGGHK